MGPVGLEPTTHGLKVCGLLLCSWLETLKIRRSYRSNCRQPSVPVGANGYPIGYP